MLKINDKITDIPVNLTAAYFKQARAQYLQGSYKGLLALIDRAEEDSFVFGCLIARHAGYKRAFTIVPASTSAADQRAAELIQNIFNTLYTRDLFEAVIDARMKWYSVIALEWNIINGYQVPVSFEAVHQKYFKYDKASKELVLDFGTTTKKIPAGSAFIVESNKKAVMFRVLKDFIRKEAGEQCWNDFLEEFGQPMVIAKYPPNSSEDLKGEIRSSLNAMGRSTKGMVPDTTDVTIQESRRDTGDHDKFITNCREGISMALLGHKEAAGSDKTMTIGDGSAGLQVKREIALDDMSWLEDRLRPFIKMIVDRNFSTAVYPNIVFDKIDPVDLKTKLTAAELGLSHGAQIDPVFLREYGIPVTNPEQPLQQQGIGGMGM